MNDYLKDNLLFSEIKKFYPDFQDIKWNPMPLMRGDDAHEFSRQMMDLAIRRKIARKNIVPEILRKYGFIRLTR